MNETNKQEYLKNPPFFVLLTNFTYNTEQLCALYANVMNLEQSSIIFLLPILGSSIFFNLLVSNSFTDPMHGSIVFFIDFFSDNFLSLLVITISH